MATQLHGGRSPEPAAAEQWLDESYAAMHGHPAVSGGFRTFEYDADQAFAHLLTSYAGDDYQRSRH